MARNLGAHVPPVTLPHAGSTHPMESPQKKFNGKKASGASHGPKRPHQGGSSYEKLSIKIEKLNSPIRKWNALSVKRSASITTATATVTTPAHPRMICCGVLAMYVKDTTVINRKQSITLVILPHVLKLIFSDSNPWSESSKRPRKSFSWPYTEWDNCRTVGPWTVRWPSQ